MRRTSRWPRQRAGGSALRLALAAPALALGFACVFDGVLVVTSWQHLQRGAAELAQSAGATGADGDMAPAFARAQAAAAPAEVARSGALVLRLLAPDETILRQWRRGTLASPPWRAGRWLRGCPGAAFVAELALPLTDWLVAAPAVRAALPVLRARAVACAGH